MLVCRSRGLTRYGEGRQCGPTLRVFFRLTANNQQYEQTFVQVYTQGLHRREFEVGYTHRRERALKEGEDASIELARQMEAQVTWSRGTWFCGTCRSEVSLLDRYSSRRLLLVLILVSKENGLLVSAHSFLSNRFELFLPPPARLDYAPTKGPRFSTPFQMGFVSVSVRTCRYLVHSSAPPPHRVDTNSRNKQALQGQQQQPPQQSGGATPPAASGNYPGLGAPAAGVAGEVSKRAAPTRMK